MATRERPTATAVETPDLKKLLGNLKAGRVVGNSFVALLGLHTAETPALVESIRKGLSYQSWERLLKNSGLVVFELADAVHITTRTLSRRKTEGRFQPDESDRIARVARVFAAAISLFEGAVEPAREWFTVPQRALGGATPLHYASTEIGALEVERLIGRLEHGIAS